MTETHARDRDPGQRLFVYGTLRSDAGHPMHDVLAAGARFDGRARVRGHLEHEGEYLALVPAADPDAPHEGDGEVEGELWIITDPAIWPTLDAYEGTGTRDPDAYDRIALPLQDRPLWAWAYVRGTRP